MHKIKVIKVKYSGYSCDDMINVPLVHDSITDWEECSKEDLDLVYQWCFEQRTGIYEYLVLEYVEESVKLIVSEITQKVKDRKAKSEKDLQAEKQKEEEKKQKRELKKLKQLQEKYNNQT